MPIKRAALRQMRKDHKRTQRNQAAHSELKTLKKRFLSLVNSQKRDEATSFLPVIMRRFDQAAAKGLIHRNTASRIKSRLSKRLTKTSSPARPKAAA